MLAEPMATKKTAHAKAKPKTLPPRTQINIRISDELAEKLDRWLTETNEGRRVKLTQSDLVRGFLDWGADTKPNWEGK